MANAPHPHGFFKLYSPDLLRTFCEEVAAQKPQAEASTSEGLVVALINDASNTGATDIHLDSMKEGLRLRFRVDGKIVNTAMLEPWCGKRLVGFLKTHAGLEPAPALEPSDSHLESLGTAARLNLRLACAPCYNGEKLTLRLLPNATASRQLTELGVDPSDVELISDWLGDMSGILLAAGPTGSGKTTTLYSLLNELNLVESNIITIEDPIEYQIEGINQMELNRDRGINFAEGLRASLRHDPDYILLGEIRDEASAQVAFDAANIGHVIFSTIHSRDAAGVVTTLRGFELKDQEIATSVAMVIAQRLVGQLCPACHEMGKPDDRDARWLESLGIAVPESVASPKGCDKCRGQGFVGRTGVFELWPVDHCGYRQILEHTDEQTIREVLRQRGLRSMIEDGVRKAEKGLIQLAGLRQMGARSYLDRVQQEELLP